jgi:KEOPS complex subunit Pcc1
MLKSDINLQVMFDSKDDSKVIYESLIPELDSSLCDKTQIKSSRNGRLISLAFSDIHTSSLRSSINSYMRWMMIGTAILAIERSD